MKFAVNVQCVTASRLEFAYEKMLSAGICCTLRLTHSFAMSAARKRAQRGVPSCALGVSSAVYGQINEPSVWSKHEPMLGLELSQEPSVWSNIEPMFGQQLSQVYGPK